MAIMPERKMEMSNPRAWRAKPRTTTPNARQKRNGLFLDAHPTCQRCGACPSEEAHHVLPKSNPRRFDWKNMMALCRACHIGVHSAPPSVLVSAPPPAI